MKTDSPAGPMHLAELSADDSAAFKSYGPEHERAAKDDPEVVRADEAYAARRSGDVNLLSSWVTAELRGKREAALEGAARRLRSKPDPLVERQIDRDPKVVALRRKLAALDRARLRLVAALETERVEALWRICKQLDAANLARGAVMPAEVRAQLSEAIDLHGLDFAAGKLGVSPCLLEQLVAGIPVPVGWTELPEEQALAAE